MSEELKRCSCGAVLTDEEIRFYGVSCNDCENRRTWGDRCRECDDTGITIQTERRCACQPPQSSMEGVDRENAAWAWLEREYGTEADDPVDRAYDASEMVNAFHAGHAFRFQALAAENARLARALRGWLHWLERVDRGDDCEYLNGNAWPDAEALASTSMGVLAALDDREITSTPVVSRETPARETHAPFVDDVDPAAREPLSDAGGQADE